MMGKKSILVIESKALFDNLLSLENKKIHFIHFNHTNGLLNPESQQTKQVKENGFHLATFNQRIAL